MISFKPSIPVGLTIGCAFSLLVANARAQTQIPTNDAAARAEAPREGPVPQVGRNTPAGVFGGRGQLAISSDAGLTISNTSHTGPGGSTTAIQLSPAVDYFVMDYLSVGGFLLLDYVHTPGGHSTTFGIGPRVGYDIPFSPLFSVWPKVGLSFAHTNESGGATTVVNGGSTQTFVSGASTNNMALNLFVPVMVHPAPHFFVGFGPALDVDLIGDVRATTIAGRLTIGGWL